MHEKGNNWRIKNQLDATYYFIALLIWSTYFNDWPIHFHCAVSRTSPILTSSVRQKRTQQLLANSVRCASVFVRVCARAPHYIIISLGFYCTVPKKKKYIINSRLQSGHYSWYDIVMVLFIPRIVNDLQTVIIPTNGRFRYYVIS